MDRTKWAEGLIRQLPEDHDGRNSWLLNHGTSAEAIAIRQRDGRGIPEPDNKPPTFAEFYRLLSVIEANGAPEAVVAAARQVAVMFRTLQKADDNSKIVNVRYLRNRLYADGNVDMAEQIDRALGDNPVTPQMASAQRSIAEELMAAKSRISELEAANILPAVMRLVAERKRQIAAEGWTPAHDDEHVFGELATAAACYAWRAVWQTAAENDEPPNNWPWDDAWWKPDTQERMLEKAGAMIVAELERLERAKT